MGFWKEVTRLKIPVKVLSGGHVLTDKHLPVPIQIATFAKGDNPGEVMAILPMIKEKKVFKFTNLEWEESHARSGGKAAVGAIAGSIVAGPLGTIAGAAIGGKKQDTSKAYMFLTDQEGNEHRVHIYCDEKLYSQLSFLLS
jgi:hypothetical protein